MAQMFYFAHQYDDAIALCKETLGIDSDFINAHSYLYQAYTQKVMYPEAVEEFFKLQKLTGDNLYNDPANEGALSKAYATDGVRGFWKANLDLLPGQRDYAYAKAEYNALLGEKDQALKWLEKSCESRNFDFVFVNVNPTFAALRNHPRFRSLVTCAGLGLPDDR
jgi:tetratricopeptide (TPR) repeat protein